jgi:pSer/pThr/pTyr-binding forkhead associated (FHA) protein
MAHGGREKGVSRLHAALYRIGYMLSIVDLESTNGTYRNGVRLVPNRPRVLIDGDELCFGNMLFHIHFGY